MPASTLPDMILGYTVILGILILYVLSLVFRLRRVKTNRQNSNKIS